MSKWIEFSIQGIISWKRYISRVCLKGNSPEQEFKVPKLLLSEIKDVFLKNNQEIGLEAAIFWRSRNRALININRKKYQKFKGSK